MARDFVRTRGATAAAVGSSGVDQAFGLALSICVVLFSWTVATFPGEWQEQLGNRCGDLFRRATKRDRRIVVALPDWLFNLPTSMRRRAAAEAPFSPTRSSCPASTSTRASASTIPRSRSGRDFVFRARGRDLSGAILDFANLPKVDFEGAELQGASLKGAQLQVSTARASERVAHSLSFRARRSTTRSFRVRRSSARGFRARRSSARDFRVRRSTALSFRARSLETAQNFTARRSTALNLRAWLDGAQLQGAFAHWRAASGRLAGRRAASGRVARPGAASGRVVRLRAASGRVARWRAASGRDVATRVPRGDRSFARLSLAEQCVALSRAHGFGQLPRELGSCDFLIRSRCGGRRGRIIRAQAFSPWNDGGLSRPAPDDRVHPAGRSAEAGAGAHPKARLRQLPTDARVLRSCPSHHRLKPSRGKGRWKDAGVDDASYSKALAATIEGCLSARARGCALRVARPSARCSRHLRSVLEAAAQKRRR